MYTTLNRIKFLPHNAFIVTQILVTKYYEFKAISGASYGGEYTDDAIHEGLSVSVQFSLFSYIFEEFLKTYGNDE